MLVCRCCPNCTATLSRSARLTLYPTFHTSKCRAQTLICGELCKSRRIAAAVERRYRRTNFRLGISQLRATGKIEHGLFRSSDQRWTQWRFDALSVECVGITTDETNPRRAVCQCDRPVLARNRDHRRRQRTRYGSQHARCADAHDNRLIRPVNRRRNTCGGCLEPRQPGPADIVRRDDDVVAGPLAANPADRRSTATGLLRAVGRLRADRAGCLDAQPHAYRARPGAPSGCTHIPRGWLR